MFRPMRRFKQQISDEECIRILMTEKRGVLSIHGEDGYPYGIPLNHWYNRQNCIGNMTYQEAADLAGETGADMVIPGHWDMFADNSADPREFSDYLDAKYHGKITCKIPAVMEKIVYQRRTVG